MKGFIIQPVPGLLLKNRGSLSAQALRVSIQGVVSGMKVGKDEPDHRKNYQLNVIVVILPT
jgi:hypothetical protein